MLRVWVIRSFYPKPHSRLNLSRHKKRQYLKKKNKNEENRKEVIIISLKFVVSGIKGIALKSSYLILKKINNFRSFFGGGIGENIVLEIKGCLRLGFVW